jgi:hypothetical protein
MVEIILEEREKLEVLVGKQDFPYIFIKPNDKFESFNIEIFIDKRCKEHSFNKTIPGRFIFLGDPILDGKKHLDIKYFKVKILNLK